MAVGQVDPEQAVGGAGGVDHRPHLGGGASQGLLAEDRDPGLEGPDRLLGVQGARGGDHQAVQPRVQKGVEIRRHLAVGGELHRLGDHGGRGVGDRGGLDRPGGQHGLHAMAADPAHAQEAQPGPRGRRRLRPPHRDGLAHGVTRALRKPSGRSRVALSASSSRSSG